MEEPTEDAQDLVFLSSRAPWSLAIDSFKTNQHDFLLNQYYSLAPLEIDGRSNISLRLIPNVEPGPGWTREEKIRAAVNAGDVVLDLQIRENDRGTGWKPLLEIRLRQEVHVDADSLRFWPFRAGQGLRPQGWMEYLKPLPDLLDRLSSQAEEAADSAPRSPDQPQRRSRPLGLVIADTTVKVVNGALFALNKAQQLARQTRTLADRLMNKTLREAQTSAADAAVLATASAEVAKYSVQEVVQETARTSQAAADQARENLRHTRQATRQAASRATDRALEAGNRAGEAVARTSAEIQKAEADIRTRTTEAGAQITEEANRAAQDVGRRTQQAAANIKEGAGGSRRKRNRARSKVKVEQPNKPH